MKVLVRIAIFFVCGTGFAGVKTIASCDQDPSPARVNLEIEQDGNELIAILVQKMADGSTLEQEYQVINKSSAWIRWYENKKGETEFLLKGSAKGELFYLQAMTKGFQVLQANLNCTFEME